jgi:hypothetical protein
MLKVFMYSVVVGIGLFIGLTIIKLWITLLLVWLGPTPSLQQGVKLLF